MNKNLIVSIDSGKHIINPAMSLDIPLNFGFHSRTTYLITGENGTGKSSFVRNILFKSIQTQCRGKIQYLYFDQEILSQFYYAKAYFAINHKSNLSNIKDFIYSVVKLHIKEQLYEDKRFLLVLDETDKYVETAKLLNLFSQWDITLINISHNPVPEFRYDYNIQINKQDEFNSTLTFK